MKFIIIELTYTSQNGVHDSYIGVDDKPLFSIILELSKCGRNFVSIFGGIILRRVTTLKMDFILHLSILVVEVSTAGGFSMLTSRVYPVLYRSNPFGSTQQYFVCRT